MKQFLLIFSLLFLFANKNVLGSKCTLSPEEMTKLEAEITQKVIADLENEITAKVIAKLNGGSENMDMQLFGICDWKPSLDGKTCWLQGVDVAVYDGNLIVEPTPGKFHFEF
jgi:hypothetical protein